MENLFQFGGQKTLTYKKNHFQKQFEKFLGPVLDEENALLASGLVLVQAFYSALENNDIEKMIDISDRWMILSKMLGGETVEEEEIVSPKSTIGFIIEEEKMEINNDDSPEGPNQSKSWS